MGNRFINLGVSKNRVENVLWRVGNILFVPSLKNAVILCGTSNIVKIPLYDVAQGLIAIGSVLKNHSSNPNILISGKRPRDESFLVNRLVIDEVNNRLKFKCSVKSFHFLNQIN